MSANTSVTTAPLPSSVQTDTALAHQGSEATRAIMTLPGAQARDTRIAVPDLSSFNFVAFLDWIELELSLVAPTQARHLRKSLPAAWSGMGNAAPYVKSASSAHSTTDTVFRLRIQDPTSALSVSNDLRRLAESFKFANPAKIFGMEVGVDAWPRTAAVDVVAMAEHFNRALAKPVSDNRRIPGPKGTRGLVTSANEHRLHSLNALRSGYPIEIGDKDANRAQRIYAKDLGTPSARARCEITLLGDACPVSSLEDLARFRFESLSKWFRWRKVDPMSTVPAAWRERQITLTHHNHEALRAKHARVHVAGTKADTAMYREAVKALRRLSTEQGKDWKSIGSARAAGEVRVGSLAANLADLRAATR